jgi:hypothetical protein
MTHKKHPSITAVNAKVECEIGPERATTVKGFSGEFRAGAWLPGQ